MKCNIKYVMSLMFLLLSALGAWADPNITVIKQLNGDVAATTSPGDVTYRVSDGTCTLTVTPGLGNYVTSECITVFPVVTGNVAQGRRSAPNLDVAPIEVTPLDASANPSGTTRYTFMMPADGSDVEVTVNFLSYAMYNIYIGGTQVTEMNRDDIIGDGKVSYNPKTNTLTLNNVSMEVKNGVGIEYYDGTADLFVHLVGINKMECAENCKGFQTTGKKFIFTTDEGEPGELDYTGKGLLFANGTNCEYQNGLGYSTTVEGQMIGVFQSYDLWVTGIRVTSVNKDNVLNDANATVRFNPVTNSLLFYGANVSINPGDTTSLVRCALSEGLTVELRGTNTLAFSAGFRNMLNTNVPLTFTTNDTKPGQLSWTLQDDVEGFFSTRFNIGYEADLELQTSGNLISVTPPVDYGLLVGTTVVTSVNCTDILGDGTVKYTDDDKTLVLTNATLTVPVVSGLSQLKIYLQGNSTISGTENMLTSSVADAPLTFTTSLSNPGELTLTKTTGQWISGFAAPSYDNPLSHKEVGNDMVILDPASIAPIVNEENPSVEVPLSDPSNGSGEPVVNETIDDVMYNLPAHSYDEGSGTNEDPAGAVLDQVVAQNATFFENNEPGTDDFAAGFTGLVFMLAPGTGDIQIDANILEGNKLAVQIGLSDPVLLPNESNPTVGEMTTYYVPFAVTDRTYVYVYLAEVPNPAAARGSVDPNREKVLHGHVKVSQLGVSSSSMVNSNVYSEQDNNVGRQVKLYSLPKSAVADGGNGVVLSTVALADVATSRAISREAAPEEYPITELAPTVFDGLDKSKVLYIDLKGTALEDFTVNRTKGIMSGFGSNTLIYLPGRNDDGGEPNVVINNECARLSLNSDSKFRSPAEFTAAEASLNRTFTIGRTSTVFLPFALTKAQADALGSFYKFQEIDGDDAVFYPAEADGIEANKPYIFTPATEKVSATNVSVVKVNSFSATQGNLIGTYEQIEWVVDPGNIYGFAAADDGGIVGGQFVRAAAGAWIPPFRAYLQVDAAPSRLNIVIGEQETDDIREIPVSREDASTAYDLQGRKVSNLTPGLYIINGKKVVVK